jgi:hypothetical protein
LSLPFLEDVGSVSVVVVVVVALLLDVDGSLFLLRGRAVGREVGVLVGGDEGADGGPVGAADVSYVRPWPNRKRTSGLSPIKPS